MTKRWRTIHHAIREPSALGSTLGDILKHSRLSSPPLLAPSGLTVPFWLHLRSGCTALPKMLPIIAAVIDPMAISTIKSSAGSKFKSLGPKRLTTLTPRRVEPSPRPIDLLMIARGHTLQSVSAKVTGGISLLTKRGADNKNWRLTDNQLRIKLQKLPTIQEKIKKHNPETNSSKTRLAFVFALCDQRIPKKLAPCQWRYDRTS